MAAKTWETDFRYAAISESVKELNRVDADDLFDFPGSFCVPVAKKPIVGWTPGRIFLIFLVLGFALLGGGVVLMGIAERKAKQMNGANTVVLESVGACLGVAGMACFFLPLIVDRWIMKCLIGPRGKDLASHAGDLLCAEISNADRRKMTLSIDGDDYVLLLADYANHRLLIEGIAARYMLRATDVLSLNPFLYLNYVGAEIKFRINDKTSLTMAIARVSTLLELTRQVPLLFFLRKLIKNRILQVCTQALATTAKPPGFVPPP